MPISVVFHGNYITTSAADGIYLRLDCSNDPLTGQLYIQPSTGTSALRVSQDISIFAGKKLILDGT